MFWAEFSFKIWPFGKFTLKTKLMSKNDKKTKLIDK